MESETASDAPVQIPVVEGQFDEADGGHRMRAQCPHCGYEDAWGMPIATGTQGVTESFPVGCGNCKNGFRIEFPRELYAGASRA
jgi:hypothetical protein